MSHQNNPLHSKEAAALLKDTARLKALLSSPETKQLMGMLNRQNGNLGQAAAKAKSGDLSALNAMLQQVMNTKEGAQLVNTMKKKL